MAKAHPSSSPGICFQFLFLLKVFLLSLQARIFRQVAGYWSILPGMHLIKKPTFLALLIFGLPFLSAGCLTLKDPEASQIHAGQVIATVQADQVVGQSFFSRREGFNGLDLWLNLSPDSNSSDGSLIIELYPEREAGEPLAIAFLSFSQIAASNPLFVSFSPQSRLSPGSYFLSLKSVDGNIDVLGRAEDIYPHGSAYLNGAPADSDLAFRLSYDYGLSGLLEDIQTLLVNLWLVLPLALVLWLPGWFLLDVTRLGGKFNAGESLALSIGLSMAVIPLIMTWTSWLGLAWSQISLWVVVGLLSLYALWRLLVEGFSFSRLNIDGHMLALAGVFLLTLLVRTTMVRDLFASPWVDSIHHGMITRLILESGGYPESYAPYLSLVSSRYHPGFHSLLAAFVWLANLDLERAMLVFGQVLNALIVFPVYLLARTLTKDKASAVGAALIAGLFSPMPAYYTSWGRYTHLAALIVLPVAFVWVQLLQERLTRFALTQTIDEHTPGGTRFYAASWKMLLLAGIASAGLFLTHYRVTIFLTCLILADFVGHIYPRRKLGLSWIDLLKDLGVIFLAGLFALLLILPWLPSTIANLFIPILSLWRGGTATPFSSPVTSFLTTALGSYTLVLAGLGLLLALLQRRWFALTLILWVGMLLSLANMDTLGLLGGGFITNLSVEITLFIPISILGGYLIAEIIRLWKRVISPRWHRVYDLGTVIVVLFFSLIAARYLIPILNPVTFIFRQADKPALAWIEDNLPADETVLINPFPWGYGLYAGNDGGYWITPLTGLKTMPPPVLYGLDNNLPAVQEINELNRQVIEAGGDAQALHTLMSEAGINYIYLGVRGGAISPSTLLSSTLFNLLYNQDGAWLFALNPG